MKHTKEPWVVDQDGDRIGNAEGSDVLWGCGCCGSPNLGAEDARRIVACVNACEGISTETLEQRGMIPVTALEQQRDEILNALKVLRNVKTTGELAWAHELADDVIAKVGAGETAPEGHNAKSEPTAPLLAQVGSTDGLGVAVPPAPTFEHGEKA